MLDTLRAPTSMQDTAPNVGLSIVVIARLLSVKIVGLCAKAIGFTE